MIFNRLDVAVLLLLSLTAAGAFAQPTPIRELVPVEIGGWKGDGKDGTYDRKNLFDYIDGGAEVYLAYGYKEAFARRFLKAGQPAITADVFDMASPEDAYGIFSFEREGPDAGVGQDSEYNAGFLRFWKGKYFVQILADKETPNAKKAVMDLGKAVAGGIKETGARPKALHLLPQKDLIATSVRFFHQKSGLDYHYYVADKNILNLSEKTNVVLAKYRIAAQKPKPESKAQFMLAEYPTEPEAVKAYAGFTKAYMPDAKGTGIVKTENGKWTASKVQGRYVAAVFDAPSKTYAESLMKAVVVKKEVTPK